MDAPQVSSPQSGLAASWYEASLKSARPNYPQLQSTVECDVCVVGGGFAGLHTALNLAEAGKKVVLVEAGQIAAGASGRNGGHVIPEFACGAKVLEKDLGLLATQKLWNEVRFAAKRIRELIAEYNIPCDYATGHLLTALNNRQLKSLLAWGEIANRHFGHSYQIVTPENLDQYVACKKYLGGIYEEQGGHLQPLEFALGLARALCQKQGEIYQQSAVSSWQILPDGQVSVRTSAHNGKSGEIRTKYLVLTTNVGINSINTEAAQQIQRRIMPVGTVMVATEPLSTELAAEILPTNAAVCDVRHVLSYYRLSVDRRLLFGGRCSYLGKAEPHGFAASLQKEIDKTFPQLGGIKIDYAWGGLIDISLSRAPDCGQIANLPIFYAQGFSGSGVVATAAIGKFICQAILGDSELLRLCEQLKHRNFPGGELLRGPLTALGNMWYRLMDVI